MPRNGRAQQVEADDVIAQIGAKSGGDRFRDLDGRKLDSTLPDRVVCKRRNRDAVSLLPVEECLDLAVPPHPVRKTGPAGTPAWIEHRTHQREYPGWLDKQPRRSLRQMLTVQLGQPRFKIIVDQRDGEVRRTLCDANAQIVQSGTEFRGSRHVDRLDTNA